MKVPVFDYQCGQFLGVADLPNDGFYLDTAFGRWAAKAYVGVPHAFSVMPEEDAASRPMLQKRSVTASIVPVQSPTWHILYIGIMVKEDFFGAGNPVAQATATAVENAGATTAQSELGSSGISRTTNTPKPNPAEGKE